MLRKLLLFAALAGAIASVRLDGAEAEAWGVPAEGAPCGRGSRVATCDRGSWCEPAAGQCRADKSAGTCFRAPQVCTMIYRPVCGCDGRTYGNDCERRAQRVGKKHEGAC